MTFWTTFYESWWGAELNYSMLTSGFTPSEFRMSWQLSSTSTRLQTQGTAYSYWGPVTEIQLGPVTARTSKYVLYGVFLYFCVILPSTTYVFRKKNFLPWRQKYFYLGPVTAKSRQIGQRPLPDLNFELKIRVDYFLLIYHRHQHRDILSWFHKRFSIFILRSRNLLNLLRSWLPMLQSWQQGLNFHWNSLKIFKLRQNIYPNFRTGSTFLNLA